MNRGGVTFGIALLFLTACTKTPEYNLVVHLSVDSKDINLEYTIQSATLSCSSIPMTNGETNDALSYEYPTSPESWCNAKALNVPLKTKNKDVDLFFLIEPSPLSPIIKLANDPFSYDTPLLGLEIDQETFAVSTENIQN